MKIFEKVIDRVTRRKFYREKYLKEYQEKFTDDVLGALEKGEFTVHYSEYYSNIQSKLDGPLIVIAANGHIGSNIVTGDLIYNRDERIGDVVANYAISKTGDRKGEKTI